MHDTLISATQLQALRTAGTPLVLLDCGFDLADPGAGGRAHAAGHLPDALYVHLERDLSGPKTGRNGRHPLPERAAFAATAGRLGIAPGVQVVCYDAQDMPYAARGWWLLRWLGHRAVAVLDGGAPALARRRRRMGQRPRHGTATTALPGQRRSGHAHAECRRAGRPTGPARPADAGGRPRERALSRRGGPLDPVAGHIPGATNRFFKRNLGPDGRMRAAPELRAEFEALGAAPVVHQCGSGVTACHNLLAMAHAGLGDTMLYPGSWSEWCADPARPVERG